jgi:hypothetical protein
MRGMVPSITTLVGGTSVVAVCLFVPRSGGMCLFVAFSVDVQARKRTSEMVRCDIEIEANFFKLMRSCGPSVVRDSM